MIQFTASSARVPTANSNSTPMVNHVLEESARQEDTQANNMEECRSNLATVSNNQGSFDHSITKTTWGKRCRHTLNYNGISVTLSRTIVSRWPQKTAVVPIGLKSEYVIKLKYEKRSFSLCPKQLRRNFLVAVQH